MLLSTPPYDSEFIAPDFTLRNVISEEMMTLSEHDLSHGFVVAFICNHCPYVQAIIQQLKDVADTLQKKGIKVFAVMSNNYDFVEADSPENMKLFAAEHNLGFPYLVDETQDIARAYDAVCTPDLFGFNAERQMQYRGRIDELQAAMLEIAEGGTTSIQQEPSQGCSIKWK